MGERSPAGVAARKIYPGGTSEKRVPLRIDDTDFWLAVPKFVEGRTQRQQADSRAQIVLFISAEGPRYNALLGERIELGLRKTDAGWRLGVHVGPDPVPEGLWDVPSSGDLDGPAEAGLWRGRVLNKAI